MHNAEKCDFFGNIRYNIGYFRTNPYYQILRAHRIRASCKVIVQCSEIQDTAENRLTFRSIRRYNKNSKPAATAATVTAGTET